MANINVGKLHAEIEAAGIAINGCDSNGTVWDKGNKEIQNRADVKAILAKHDPTPIPVVSVDDEIKKLKADIELLKNKRQDKA